MNGEKPSNHIPEESPNIEDLSSDFKIGYLDDVLKNGNLDYETYRWLDDELARIRTAMSTSVLAFVVGRMDKNLNAVYKKIYDLQKGEREKLAQEESVKAKKEEIVDQYKELADFINKNYKLELNIASFNSLSKDDSERKLYRQAYLDLPTNGDPNNCAIAARHVEYPHLAIDCHVHFFGMRFHVSCMCRVFV